MNVGDVCSRAVVTVKPGDALAEAARELVKHQVGALVVVDPREPERPVGILTDRDVVRGQLARKADLFCLTVGDVMTPRPFTIHRSASLSEAIEFLNEHGVRRAPVVNHLGELLGIVTLDDLLPALSAEIDALAKLLGTQARKEQPAV